MYRDVLTGLPSANDLLFFNSSPPTSDDASYTLIDNDTRSSNDKWSCARPKLALVLRRSLNLLAPRKTWKILPYEARLEEHHRNWQPSYQVRRCIDTILTSMYDDRCCLWRTLLSPLFSLFKTVEKWPTPVIFMYYDAALWSMNVWAAAHLIRSIPKGDEIRRSPSWCVVSVMARVECCRMARINQRLIPRIPTPQSRSLFCSKARVINLWAIRCASCPQHWTNDFCQVIDHVARPRTPFPYISTWDFCVRDSRCLA